jgi:hypothetical protein
MSMTRRSTVPIVEAPRSTDFGRYHSLCPAGGNVKKCGGGRFHSAYNLVIAADGSSVER